jgi:alpha/beta superfamily hydrolase
MSALAIGRPPRVLEADLALPPGAPRAGAVVCHPHPQYGGDMENAVVVAAAAALVAAGVAVLRFNFGGVGRSTGVSGGGAAEVGDVRTAFDALAARFPAGAPLVLVGYSFGAWAALRAAADGCPARRIVAIGPPLAFLDWSFLDVLAAPVDVVVGDRDQFCDAGRLGQLPARIGRRIIRGADHFFGGREVEVVAAVADCLAGV